MLVRVDGEAGARRARPCRPDRVRARGAPRLLGESLRNAEIAQRLVLSPRTVDHHVSRILAKLGARSRAEAVAAARELGVAESR
jgi:ATP/maltotriose-dependent transcriptional regulator MalT